MLLSYQGIESFFKTLSQHSVSLQERRETRLLTAGVVRKWKACWPRWSSRKKPKNTVRAQSTQGAVARNMGRHGGRRDLVSRPLLEGTRQHSAHFPKESMARGGHDSPANYLNTGAPRALLAGQLSLLP